MNSAEPPERPSPDASPTPSLRHRETVDQFVQLWGKMASTWGINRTMAQIHALLYCSQAPLNTDDIMARLDISRGNANMNLRSLAEWDLIEKTHLTGSRKDFFVAKKDVWHITATILQERERREIKPVKQQLGTLRDHLKSTPSEGCDDLAEHDAALCWRIQRLIELIDVFDSLFEALLPLIEERNVATIKQLAQWAQSVEAADE